MKTLIGILLTLSLLLTNGCSNQVFVQKERQTNKAFETDKSYCRTEALGGWKDQNGTSNIQLRSQMTTPMSYEDCMRQMGYQQQ